MKTLKFAKTLAVAVLAALTIGCTEKEKGETAVIGVAEPVVSITDEEQEFAVAYTVSNITDGAALRAVPQAAWLHVGNVGSSEVTVIADANESEEARKADIVLSYTGAEDVTVSVEQAGKYVAPKTLTFEIKVLSVASRMVYVECVPSDPEATYIAMATHKADFDKFPTEEALIANDMEYFKSWGSSFSDEEGPSEDEPWTKFLRKGSMLDYDIQLDKPDADYVFYAYGLDKDGSVTSPHIYKVEFHTTLPEHQECTFKFRYRPGMDYGRVNVYPSDIHVSYIWGVCPKSDYDAIEGDKAQTIVDQIRKDMGTVGGTWRDYVGYHNRYQNYNLKSGEVYVAYAFGADITGVPTTAAQSIEFTAKTVAKQDCNFSFAFQDVRATTFAAQITPSSDVKWVAYTLPFENTESFNSVEDMTEVVIDTFNEMLDDGWWNDPNMAHTGSQLLSSYQLQASQSLDSSTKQIVCAFGVNDEGCRVTPVAQGIVTTAALGQPSSMTIDFEVSKKDGASVIEFKPSKMEAYFYDLITYEDYSQYATDDALYAEAMWRYSSMIQYKITMGDAKMTTESLTPGVKYVAYAFGMDGDRSTAIFKKVFTAE